MGILVIGGTGFLGRHVVEAARRRGHALTLFNRGVTAPGLFPELETLRGDRRTGDLGALEGREFDAVIDTCGYLPAEVRSVAGFLANSVAHYTFVSSISVYPDPVAPGTDESAPVSQLDGPAPEEVTDETYGPLKALCEQAAEAALPGRVLSLRPCLIAGPGDPTDRFTYWPRRIAEGGRVLAGRPEQPIQLIDVRDLAAWSVHAAEGGLRGTYNAVGPAEPLSMARLFEACRDVASSDAEPVWAGDRFLREQGVEPWSELPLWVPAEEGGFQQVDCSRATSRGLSFRPLAETIDATLAWDRNRPPAERVDLLPREREQDLLRSL
jgi:2'-hydroxyisoflavone reductase